jgi:D-lactate dehydrogenase (cytochrome)
VPISRLPDLVRETKQDYEENGLEGIIGGHIGDGNFHSMMVYRSQEEYEKLNQACKRLVHRAILLDGTCMYLDPPRRFVD